ncbi:hypothetical protein ACT3TJ_13225 [Halomonas sp. AOP30-A1-24]|uniref:hypothetical protein n=1 Tax=Halomonas sp. AOP30-A1-24 TaxID=3457698 RepID=UPI004033FBB1
MMTQLAYAVGCDIVAEGIGIAEHAADLHSIGCEAAQGDYYARPLPANVFVAWYKDWTSQLPPHTALEPA